MKTSNTFFYISFAFLLITPFFVLFLDYYMFISVMMFAIIFFTVGIFVRIFEYLEDLERRSRPTYEQFEEIFKKHFIKKKKEKHIDE